MHKFISILSSLQNDNYTTMGYDPMPTPKISNVTIREATGGYIVATIRDDGDTPRYPAPVEAIFDDIDNAMEAIKEIFEGAEN